LFGTALLGVLFFFVELDGFSTERVIVKIPNNEENDARGR